MNESSELFSSASLGRFSSGLWSNRDGQNLSYESRVL